MYEAIILYKYMYVNTKTTIYRYFLHFNQYVVVMKDLLIKARKGGGEKLAIVRRRFTKNRTSS